MLSRNQIKFYTSLRQKKFRDETNTFLAEGDKMVTEILSRNQEFLRIKSILALPVFFKELDPPDGIMQIEVSESELKKISSLITPNQAILEIEKPRFTWSMGEFTNRYSFYLENIQDPGNLGTIIRTADWFGIRNILCSPGSVDVWNPKVIQATMGSFSRVRVFYEPIDIFQSYIEFKDPDFFRIAAVLDGESIYTANLGIQGVVFLGNESKGLGKKAISLSNVKVSIDRNPENSGAESLNVSVAAGIIGSELLRRKLIQNGN